MATDQVVDGTTCQNTMPSSSSTTSSSSSTSSTVSSPENTLHKYQTLPSPGHDLSESIPPPAASPPPSTATVGRFQVTSSADVKVGRFSVTQAEKEGAGSKGEEDAGLSSLPIVQPKSQGLLSSDDSEPEDEAFKNEIRQLRERWDL